jgi:hypothetical protein
MSRLGEPVGTPTDFSPRPHTSESTGTGPHPTRGTVTLASARCHRTDSQPLAEAQPESSPTTPASERGQPVRAPRRTPTTFHALHEVASGSYPNRCRSSTRRCLHPPGRPAPISVQVASVDRSGKGGWESSTRRRCAGVAPRRRDRRRIANRLRPSPSAPPPSVHPPFDPATRQLQGGGFIRGGRGEGRLSGAGPVRGMRLPARPPPVIRQPAACLRPLVSRPHHPAWRLAWSNPRAASGPASADPAGTARPSSR